MCVRGGGTAAVLWISTACNVWCWGRLTMAWPSSVPWATQQVGLCGVRGGGGGTGAVVRIATACNVNSLSCVVLG